MMNALDNRVAPTKHGREMREAIGSEIKPFIGVFDVFSASIAARHYDALFVSGFGFAASYYGLPDIGFISWSDMVAYVNRIRTVVPAAHILVDIDDGYCDPEVACHVVSMLEAMGASGVVLEDQQRPRRCGHFDGKQIMELKPYLEKLKQVLATRKDLFVVARTDSADPSDVLKRVEAFAEAGADAVLVDGLKDLSLLPTVRKAAGVPLVFNQISGGKSPPCDLRQLSDLGVSLVIYSTPCLFPAHAAIEDALKALASHNGLLPADPRIGVKECTAQLQYNLMCRQGQNFDDDCI